MAPSSPDFATDAFLTDARNRMVDSQLRPNKVSDPRILEAMRHLPRERFVPPGLAALAYADQTVGPHDGCVMLQPMALARLAQAAAPLKGETALVIGMGAGYAAALLAALGCAVTVLEASPASLERTRRALGDTAVILAAGPLVAGWAAGGPYDLILIDGAVPSIPAAIAAQLRPETGRLLTVMGDGQTSRAVHAEPAPAGLSIRTLFDCPCPVLADFVPAPVFAF